MNFHIYIYIHDPLYKRIALGSGFGRRGVGVCRWPHVYLMGIAARRHRRRGWV